MPIFPLRVPLDPRVFYAGGFPCCCPAKGSSQEVDGLPRGSSVGGICVCSAFENGQGPCSLRVDVQGIVDGDCGDCNLLNGAYYVQATDPIPSGSDGAWRLEFPAVCGSFSAIEVRLVEAAIGQYDWAVTIDDGEGGAEFLRVEGTQSTAGKLTIADVSGVLLTGGLGGGSKCDDANVRAALTAIV